MPLLRYSGGGFCSFLSRGKERYAMSMYDIILKKKQGKALSEAEIRWMIQGYVKEQIPDYQMAALLMAVCFQGMEDEETGVLVDAMARSGDLMDLSGIPGIKVDKHSTGGVGDKTSLILAPIVAACGVPVAKMSGRGLGHTGGTIDKLESIPGLRTSMEKEEFFRIVRKTGLAIISQTGNIAPADKKLYALRDVTATVDSIPLIASSIMSKKIAAGADAIVLDVKCGRGAFMQTREAAVKLARTMVGIGEKVGRQVVALVTDMNLPLGRSIGNALEVAEAVATLKGQGPGDLVEVCLELAANMLLLAGKGGGDLALCRQLAREALADGRAFARFKAMVEAQGGDSRVLEEPKGLPGAAVVYPVRAPREGYLESLDALGIGSISVALGAGRQKKEDAIDFGAGLVLEKKPGEAVVKDEVIAWLHTSSEEVAKACAQRFLAAATIGSEIPSVSPLIQARVTREGVTYYC